MTKGTPLSSQIIWLEERVKELEDQVQYKQNTIDALTTMCNRLQNQTGNSGLESDKIENILMDSLDARYKKKIEEMSGSAEGIYSTKRSAAVRLVEELVDEVIKSSYDDNQIKLAYAIELLKRNQS